MEKSTRIRDEFLAGDLEVINAITELEEIGYSSREAEALVDSWIMMQESADNS